MRQVVARSVRKWILLVLLGLAAYFSGWILGTRTRNLAFQTFQNIETMEAGEKDGTGGAGLRAAANFR
jgi:hypothetical protein